MSMVAILFLGFVFIFANNTFWYLAITFTLSSMAFSYFSDVMTRASRIRREYFNGSEKIDHTDEALQLYRQLGPYVSMVAPVLPIIVVAYAMRIESKLKSRKLRTRRA